MKIAILLISFFISTINPTTTISEINITSNLPKTIKSNSSFKVELTIKKGELKGFAKLEQDLPGGISAEAVDSKGGTFTFDKQKIKIIWLSLPTSDEFKISYIINVANIEKGKKVILGKLFSVSGDAKQISEFKLTEMEAN